MIAVDKLTTDADGRMAEDFSEQMEKEKGVTTEHFLETIHINRSMAAALSRVTMDINLPTDNPANYKQRMQAKNRLTDSIAWRAEGEVRAAHAVKKSGTDCDTFASVIEDTIPAMIDCFQGKHDLCKLHSRVCNGQTPVYEYLPQYATRI